MPYWEHSRNSNGHVRKPNHGGVSTGVNLKVPTPVKHRTDRGHPLPSHNKRASKLLWENDTNDQTFENLPARRSCYSTSYTKKDTHFPLTEGFCLRYCVCPKVAIKSESELACLFRFTMDTPVTMSLKSRWDTQTWWEMLFSRSENGQEAVHVNWKLLWVSK